MDVPIKTESTADQNSPQSHMASDIHEVFDMRFQYLKK